MIEWTSGPLVPVIVSVWLPVSVALHETVAVPDAARLVMLIFPQLRPFGTVSVKAIAPSNPFRAVTVIVAVLDCPAFTAAGVEAVTAKSAWLTENVATAECAREPLVPVIVNV